MSQPNDYPVFIQWYRTLNWILDRIDKMPKHLRFTLSNRIANLSLDVQTGIVEAIYSRERKPILRRINLQLEHLRILFRLCFERKLLSEKQYAFISQEINQTGKMIGGWEKHNPSI